MNRTCILLTNLGTPDSPEPHHVGKYLREFLMDPWVIDIPYLPRWILVNVLIAPLRKYKSSEAYKKIWTEKGSPLLFHHQDLLAAMRPVVEAHSDVYLCMRYGKPSAKEVVGEILKKQYQTIKIIPLYPQYAESSSRTAKENIVSVFKEFGFAGKLDFLKPFYEDPRFIDISAQLISESRASKKSDHLLLSFHGLPERHVQKTDHTSAHCLKSGNCCDKMVEANQNCYRAQCFATARAIAKKLGLERHEYSVSFQSRLGRTPWIQPFTDIRLKELAEAGVKNLTVACPSFTVDCLETLEEIGIRAKQDFKSFGGVDLQLVPCLNSDQRWVQALVQMVDDAAYETLNP